MEAVETRNERILIVDDEPEIVTLIAHHLGNAGYQASSAGLGATAIEMAARDRPDLLILDVMLPDMSGIDVLRVLRASPDHMGILLLTALREDTDRIRGLSMGADDYLTKPFNPEELVLRVGAILRRMKLDRSLNFMTVIGGLAIDRLTHRTTTAGSTVNLTEIEYKLLIALIDAAGTILGRGQLLQAVWGANPDMNTRTVDVHIQRLRVKLCLAGECVETVRGIGYRFNSRPLTAQ